MSKGLKDVDFRRVDYDVESELQLARDLKLPYYEVYYESLVNGITIPIIRTCCTKSLRVKDMMLNWTTGLVVTLDITTIEAIINIREE